MASTLVQETVISHVDNCDILQYRLLFFQFDPQSILYTPARTVFSNHRSDGITQLLKAYSFSLLLDKAQPSFTCCTDLLSAYPPGNNPYLFYNIISSHHSPRACFYLGCFKVSTHPFKSHVILNDKPRSKHSDVVEAGLTEFTLMELSFNGL